MSIASPFPRARRLSLLAALMVATALKPVSGTAQSLDYAAMEELFGEPVTSSATGTPQRATQVPADMVIITADDIRRSGARDIPGILRRVAGVDVLRSTRDHADVSIRGYNEPFAPRLLVLVDGRQVYADYYGFTPWSTVPVELAAIRQIELVKGPNSALFGFNAVGGVVNIVTYGPLDEERGTLALTAGSQDHAEASLVASFRPGATTGLRLSAGHRSSDDYDTPLPATDAGARRGNERNALNLAAGWQPDARVQVGLEATYSDAEQAIVGPLYRFIYDRYETGSLRGRVAVDTGLGLVQATAYTNRIRSEGYAPASASPDLRPDNRVTVAQLEGISKFAGVHTLRLSTEYRHNRVDTTRIGGGEVAYRVAAAAGTWEWRALPNLTFTGALRLDHWALERSGTAPADYPLDNDAWDRDDDEWSYNAAVVWTAGERDTFRLLTGRGVQLPNLLTLGGLLIDLPGLGYASGLPDLEPTVVHNYELSWDRQLERLPATLRISLYHGRSHNLLANAGDARPMLGLFGLPANVGDSRTTGMEAAIEGRLGEHWRWSASYAGQHIDDDLNPSFAPEMTLASYERSTPEHVLRAGLGFSRGRWEADVHAQYQSRFRGFERVPAPVTTGQLAPVDDLFLLDARIACSISEHVTLALSGQQLNRAELRQTSGPDVERTVLGTLTVDFGGSR